MYAPKGTPPEITKKLNDALMVALKDPEFVKRQEALGAEVVTDKRMTPAGHKAFVSDQITKLKTVIEAAGQFAD
jgi:tripartite-type tricarboxylate transporter receptor subunit TctC